MRLLTWNVQNLIPSGTSQTAPTGSDAGRAKLASLAATSNGDVPVISTHLWSKLLTFPGGRFSTSDEDERARTPRSGRKLRIPLIAVRRPFKLSC